MAMTEEKWQLFRRLGEDKNAQKSEGHRLLVSLLRDVMAEVDGLKEQVSRLIEDQRNQSGGR